jgi:hypothetical protein
MNADKNALDAEATRLADRFLAALRAGKVDDARILITALHDVNPQDDEPLPF